jgi:hypothetical protein
MSALLHTLKHKSTDCKTAFMRQSWHSGGRFDWQMVEKHACHGRDIGHGLLKSGFVGAGWLAVAADFAHKLERGIVQFFISRRAIWIAELFDIATHNGFEKYLRGLQDLGGMCMFKS